MTDLRYKYTDAQVAEVRRLAALGIRVSRIAKDTGVRLATVKAILANKIRRGGL